MTIKRKQDLTVHDNSGNVFADLGLSCTEEDMLKVKIAHAITVTVRRLASLKRRQGRSSRLTRRRCPRCCVDGCAAFPLNASLCFSWRWGGTSTL